MPITLCPVDTGSWTRRIDTLFTSDPKEGQSPYRSTIASSFKNNYKNRKRKNYEITKTNN